MTQYVDSSALAKLYLDEPGSQTAVDILGRERSTTARHTYVEVRRALHGNLSGSPLRGAQHAFELDWSEAEVVEIDEQTCRVAAALAETTGVRTLDALHLAAAQRAGGAELKFVTFDQSQAEAARSLGWTVLGV